MISTATLETIARNLCQLGLAPLVHMRVIAALAPILSDAPDDRPSDGASDGEVVRSHDVTAQRDSAEQPVEPPDRLRKAAGRRPRKPRASELTDRAKAILDRAPDLGQAALAERAGVSVATAKRAIGERRANAARPPGRRRGRKPNGAADSHSIASPARDQDERARVWIEAKLSEGPVECSIVDGEVEAHRLQVGSVERAISDLDLVACRVNLGRGRVACYATRQQAAELDAIVPERNVRSEPAPEPRA